MDDAEPGLFDWFPEPKPKPPPLRNPQRGRNRETWALTATAEVSIIDAATVDEAIVEAQARGLMIGWSDDSGADDPPLPDAGAEHAANRLDQLAWLIWPSNGMEALVESGAFQVLDMECDVVDKSADRGKATWTITVKLTNVDRLRQLAAQAHPDDAALIEDSLAYAWQCAADPFEPLRSIPGINWQPMSVDIKHLPARPAAHVR